MTFRNRMQRQHLNHKIFNEAREGNADAVIALLNEGADVNARDEKEQNTTAGGAAGGHVRVVQISARSGSGRQDSGRSGADSLTPSGAHGHSGIVQTLLYKEQIDAKGECDTFPACKPQRLVTPKLSRCFSAGSRPQRKTGWPYYGPALGGEVQPHRNRQRTPQRGSGD